MSGGGLSLAGQRWRPRGPLPEAGRVRELERRHGLTPEGAGLLLLRGWGEPGRAERYLEPGWDSLHDPWSMLEMDRAVARIRRAVRERERVRVVADYDADGLTSGLVLLATLRALGAEPDWRLPDRFGAGYGLSPELVRGAARDGVDLLVTSDLGVKDVESVALARQAGMDVLICDHHLSPGGSVPEGAVVLCPPRAGETYPHASLAACGVAFKLAQALLAEHPRREPLLASLLKLVAIGTVADVVSLAEPENRALVSLGLQALRRGPHGPGLSALLAVSRLRPERLEARDLAFRLAPRINAAGRLGRAELVLQLLLERRPHRARRLASRLEVLNRRRREIQEALVRHLLARLPNEPARFPVFAGPEAEGWHRGVLGIVAGRLRERLGRPVAVAAIADGVATGSVRSVPGVSAVEALASAGDLLLRYGGHAAAAGFALPAERLPELEERVSRFAGEPRPAERLYDLELAPRALRLALLRDLRRLGPFGAGNPEPVFRVPARPASVRGLREHLFLRPFPGLGLEAAWWGAARHAAALARGRWDLLVRLEAEPRGGLRLGVEDALPSSG